MTSDPRNPSAVGRWHFGRVPDLLLGAGLGYWLVFALMTVLGTELAALAPITLLPLVVLFTGVPHYGATLLRVCERPEDRRAYSLVTIGASLAMIVALALCLRNVLLGSLLLTLYLTWSPWHYSGQNYGIALMLLGRRGVPVSRAAKRCLYASFTLSFVLIVLSINGATTGTDYAPVAYEGTIFRHLTLGIPEVVRTPAMAAVGGAYLASLAATAVLLLRVTTVRTIAPAAAVVFSQGLWFAVPAAARQAGVFQESGPLSAGMAAYAFMWIGVAHSVQYLWVTSYFALRSRTEPSRVGDASPRAFLVRYCAKALAAGAALWVLPAFVFAPGALGRLPFDAGLAVMISAAINIHHFVLDGVIWKLRDRRIASVLLRGQRVSDAAPAALEIRRSPAGRAATATLWSVGGACALVFGGAVVEQELGLRAALERRDAARAEAAVERLAWIGRDSAQHRVSVGLLVAEQGDFAAGIEQLEQSTRVMETGSGLAALGSVYARSGRVSDAEASYRRALALEPEKPELLNNLAWLLATTARGEPSRATEAVALAERASGVLGDANATALDTLAVAYAARGDFKAARRAARRAHAIADAAGNAELAAEIDQRLALYRAKRTLDAQGE